MRLDLLGFYEMGCGPVTPKSSKGDILAKGITSVDISSSCEDECGRCIELLNADPDDSR